MPIPTEIQHCIGLFNDRNHMGILIKRFHKRVDIQFAKSRREPSLGFRAESLIPKDQHAMIKPGPADRLD